MDATRIRGRSPKNAGHANAAGSHALGAPMDPTLLRPVVSATEPNSSPASMQPSEGEPPATDMELRGRYVLESLIGQGAMGQVWRARDRLSEEARDHSPYVAVKVLNAELEDHPDAFVALHRESSRTQKLAHPNIVTVHVFERDDISRRVFIAMELLEGQPLDKALRSAPITGMPRAQALPLIRGMAEGLAYAHRKGIVHCDFKPGNVFVTRDGTPKILDFGIARAIRLPTDGGLTHDEGSFHGYTPAYAAPEMIAGGDPHPADDVFALGVVAYEVLTGRHPFNRLQADEARAAGQSARPIGSLSRREWRALEKALAFDRESRWPDAAAFTAAFYRAVPVWKSLVAVAALFALLSGALWYKGVLEQRPAVPFEQLPASVQHDFNKAIDSGLGALAYLRRTDDITASADAAEFFAQAYTLHPRDPVAIRGLEQAADLAIAWYLQDANRSAALEQLRAFQAKSPHYAKYRPLVRAIKEVEHGT